MRYIHARHECHSLLLPYLRIDDWGVSIDSPFDIIPLLLQIRLRKCFVEQSHVRQTAGRTDYRILSVRFITSWNTQIVNEYIITDSTVRCVWRKCGRRHSPVLRRILITQRKTFIPHQRHPSLQWRNLMSTHWSCTMETIMYSAYCKYFRFRTKFHRVRDVS